MKLENATQNMIHLETMNGQNSIFHYTNSKGVMGIVENKAFWATKSDFLNDPQEFQYITQVVEEISVKYIQNKIWRKLFLKAYRKRNQKASQHKEVYYAHKEYYVISFSLCRDSIALWSEFSSETGYHMEFDYNGLLESLNQMSKLIWHGKVIYPKEKQEQMLADLMLYTGPSFFGTTFEEMMKECEKKGHSSVFVKYMDFFQKVQNIYAMFLKKEGFQAENEYRFIFKRMDTDPVYFREQKGFLIPYINIPLANERSRIPVKSLMAAPKNHTDLAQKGMSYYLISKGYRVPVELSSLQLRY